MRLCARDALTEGGCGRISTEQMSGVVADSPVQDNPRLIGFEGTRSRWGPPHWAGCAYRFWVTRGDPERYPAPMERS